MFSPETFFFSLKKPFYTKNHATSSHKNHAISQQKNHATSLQKNHTTSRKINHATWVSEWEKSHNLSTHQITQPLSKWNTATCPPKKIMQPFHKKSHGSFPQKKSLQKKITQSLRKTLRELKTLPWEHHICCQMCQIAPSKSTEKVKKVTAVTVVTVVKKITQPLHKKNHATFFFTFSVNLESAIWHIWQPMWCSQGSVLPFSQCFLQTCCRGLLIWWPNNEEYLSANPSEPTVSGSAHLSTIKGIGTLYINGVLFIFLCIQTIIFYVNSRKKMDLRPGE